MKNKVLLKLKKKMEAGSKTIELGNKAIEAIKETQGVVIENFNKEVLDAVKKSEEQITYHQELIEQAKGMTL